MENPRIKLTQKEFDAFDVHYPSNLVIVQMPPEKDIEVAGIKVNFNPDTLYAEGESSHPADMAPVMGTIVKQVEKLYYNRKDTERTMSWKTSLETLVGDTVWFHHLISKNCSEIEVNKIVYKVIPYEDLFLSVRYVDYPDEFGGIDFAKIITPLNGNILLKEVFIPKLSQFDVTPDTVDPTRGIVAYNGSDNQEYQTGGADLSGLAKGDMVVINKNSYIFYLERSKYNSNFGDGERYICIQKKHLDAKI
jgi:hypothetical protein